MTEHTPPPIGKIAALLGYRGHRTYFTAEAGDSDYRHSHVIRLAFSKFNVSSVFCLEDGFVPPRLKPIVYLATVESIGELKQLWRSVWSQGAVPFLIATVGHQAFVCQTFGPPPADISKLAFDLTDDLPSKLTPFVISRLSSSLTWKDFDLRISSSVDNILVKAIEALNDRARALFPHLKDHRDLINSLIGKFLYAYALIDRGILDEAWLNDVTKRLKLPPVVVASLVSPSISDNDAQTWTTGALMAFFDAIDDEINGSVFSIDGVQRALLPDALCYLVHRVIRGGDDLIENGRQLSFIDVSFEALRTETISAIYERFIAVEDWDKRRNDGVYYTPPHLADHLLDRVEAVQQIDENSRVIDPAAGSGIFLVGAFRRLLERNSPPEGWTPSHIERARALLLNCIHGREKHPQAANVCRFSLYLTLLDYVGRAPIRVLARASGQNKFLPDLKNNIRAVDAFEPDTNSARYTHVIGNPPWSTTSGQRDRMNRSKTTKAIDPALFEFQTEIQERGLPVAHNRLAEYFVWLAKIRLCAPNGVIALVLPARSFIGRTSTRFSHAVAKELSLQWVGNLSHLRRKLFQGAEAATCVIVAVNRAPNRDDIVSVYRPLLPTLPLGKQIEIWTLLASDADIEAIRTAEFQSGANGWFRPIVLSSLDRRLNEALSDWSILGRRTFGEFLDRSGLEIRRGGSPRETGIQRAASVRTLPQSELVDVSDDFRGFFAGNAILVPRSMAAAEYYYDPIAYSSTYNAIIPTVQQEIFALDATAITPYMSDDIVAALLAYLNSDILQYFAFLFGPTYLMDNARLERGDLISFPCPFISTADEAFLTIGKADDPSLEILKAMGAGHDFKTAFDEFRTFRRRFANAQMPRESFDIVEAKSTALYLKRFRDEVVATFPSRRELSISAVQIDSGRVDIRLDFSKKPATVIDPVDIQGRYLSGTLVFVDDNQAIATLVKPRARFSWTMDHAVADAKAVANQIGALAE